MVDTPTQNEPKAIVAAYNLSSLARRLGRRGDYAKFCQAIARAHAADIAIYDLRGSQRCLEILASGEFGGPIGQQSTDQAIRGRALFTEAVISYVRGTVGRSEHKTQFDLTSKFSPDQRASHRRIVALRNNAIAHWGPGHRSDKLRWNQAAVLMADRLHGADIMFDIFVQHLRSNYQEQAGRQLAELVKFTLELALQVRSETSNQIGETLAGDAHLQALARSFPFDANDFFDGDFASIAYFYAGGGDTTWRMAPSPFEDGSLSR